MWAWVYCSWKTELLFPGMEGTNLFSDASWLANVCLVILTFCATPLLVKRMSARGRRILLVLATASMVVGVLGSAVFAGSVDALLVGSYASGALTGFGSGVLLTFVGAQFTNLTVGELETAVLLNLLFTPACSMAASMLTGTFMGVLLVALLPLAAGLLLLSSPDVDPQAPMADPQMDVYPRPPRRDILMMGAVILLFHIATATKLSLHRASSLPAPFDSLAGFFQASMALGSIATLLVCFVVMAYSRRVDFANMCRISIPAYLVGVVLMPLSALPVAGVISQAIIAFAGTYFSLIVYIVYIKLAKAKVIPVYCAVAGFMAPYELGVLLGNLLTDATMGISDGPLQLSAQVAIIVTALAAALFVAPLWNKPGRTAQRGELRTAVLQAGVAGAGAPDAEAMPLAAAGGVLSGTAARSGVLFSEDGESAASAPRRMREAALVAGDGPGVDAPPPAAAEAEAVARARIGAGAAVDAGLRAAAASTGALTGGEAFATHGPGGLLAAAFPQTASAFELSLRSLADRAGLTAREAEICGLLAQGRSRPYVRELLCVSKNTVDTHVRHAYAKLGIHSNQELIDLLQEEMARMA